MSSALITEAEPVNDFLVVVPNATTITSPKSAVEFRSSTTRPFLGWTSTAFIPIYDTTKVADASGILIVNVPLSSVIVPFDVPFTKIDAPIMGCPSSPETTFPEIDFD